MTTKFEKYGITAEISKDEKINKFIIGIMIGDHQINFGEEFYSEGEALSYASDFIDDLKGMFKPYIREEIQNESKILDNMDTTTAN